ncbi:MAG: hypothetical protein MJ252_26785 [archaeon]|nr:hypothetical protein [archaeon]
MVRIINIYKCLSEIILSRPYNGFKSDIWCMGIILYAMLCGYLPYEGV